MLTRYKTDVTQKPRFFLGFVTSACALTILILCAIFLSVNVSASTTTSASADIIVNLNSTISIRTLDSTATSEIDSLDLSLTPIPNGKFIKDTTVVDVATSNSTGYMLYMQSNYVNPNASPAGTYTTSLIHNDSAVNYTIPTIDTTISESTFSAPNTGGTANPYVDHWGYSITEKAESGTYHPIPAHGGQDLINDTVDTAVEHSYTPVTIGVNVDNNIASGTYSNSLEFTAIGNQLPVDYTLVFDGNSSALPAGYPINDVPATMERSVTATSYTFTIPTTISASESSTGKETSANPKTNYYGFVGWSEDANSRVGSGSGPDGLYLPGDTFTIVVDTSLAESEQSKRTLYAFYEPLEFFTIANMQDMTNAYCTEVTTPSNTIKNIAAADVANYIDTTGIHHGDTSYVAQRTLSDIRDSKKYIIRKMADGNCWMVDNLKFELQANKTYTGVNNATGNTITFNTGAVCGNGNTDAACIMNGNTVYGNTYDTWYYSWYAATAGSGTSSMVNQDAPYSICPAHWRLPTNYTNTSHPSGGADKSWGSLLNTYGISPNNHNSDTEYKTLEAFPFNLSRVGWFNSGAFRNNGYGVWWPTTADSTATYAHSMTFGTTVVNPQGDSSKYHGFNVRCVAI